MERAPTGLRTATCSDEILREFESIHGPGFRLRPLQCERRKRVLAVRGIARLRIGGSGQLPYIRRPGRVKDDAFTG